MKANLRNSAAFVTLALIVPAAADVTYSNLLDTAIPTGWTGVTVSVNGGSVNPFFGGVGVLNDSLFQPARVGTDQLATILNLPVGTTISSSNGTLSFSSGVGGSEDHLGTNFSAGTEGYIGFNSNGNYGWMRVAFTFDTAGAVIKDWAYDNGGSGGSIVVGRVLESVVDGTHNLVTLSPGTGETFTLGSTLADKGGGVINGVTKTGAGTTTLGATNTYSGATAVDAGTLVINGSTSTSSAVTVSNAGSKLTGSGTVGGNTTINPGAILAPGSGVGKESFSNNLTLGAASGSIFEWDLASTPAATGRGTSYDAVNVAGTLAGSDAIFRVLLNGGQDFSETFWDTARTWTDIFKSADGGSNLSIAAIFSGVEYYNSANGALTGIPTTQGYFSFSGTSMNWTAVPEPSTALAGLLLGAGLLRRRRE
jgi:autotransporter-associated beta strand protein